MMSRREKVLIGLCLLVSLICAIYNVVGAQAADFEIRIYSIFTETEESFRVLLYANCTDSTGYVHEDNVTFQVNGVDFTWSNYMDRYEATDTQNTPGTETYGPLDSFTDANNGTSTAVITVNATVTWTTGTLDRLIPHFMTGDWIGAIIAENVGTMGGLFTYTAIMAIFSIAIYNVAGPYATLFGWVLGWGVFSGVVHGEAQILGVLFLSLGFGIAVAKLYLDRRTS